MEHSQTWQEPFLTLLDRLAGLVVRSPPRERKIPGSNPACVRIFSGSSHTSDFKIGTPVATLPGSWRYWVSTGTGRPGVRILWLGEVERLICSFCLCVAGRKIVWADPSLRYTSLLLGRSATNQPTNNNPWLLITPATDGGYHRDGSAWVRSTRCNTEGEDADLIMMIARMTVMIIQQ